MTNLKCKECGSTLFHVEEKEGKKIVKCWAKTCGQIFGEIKPTN